MKSDPPKSLSVSIRVKTALDDELLTHEELAGRFKVKEREIHRRRTAGDIPFVLLGPKIIRYRWDLRARGITEFRASRTAEAFPKSKGS